MSERKAARSAKSARVAKAAVAEALPVTSLPLIELEAKVTIAQAAALHRVLTVRLEQAQPMVLNGSRIEEIDTAILQLLSNLSRSCLQRGIPFSWVGVSDMLRRTAVLIGVEQDLRFPTLEPA